MKIFMHKCLAALLMLTFSATGALAFEPKPTLIGLQEPATPNMVRLHAFHDNLLLWIIGGIVLFVFLLLVWIIIRYNARANPVPSKTTHHVGLEVVWTIAPIVILLFIAIPSYKLLFYLDRTATPDMTLRVSGYQWGWTYSYPEKEGLEFNADVIKDEELNTYIPDGKGRRLLETYNPIVLPVDKNIQILTTASDVIHSWAIPAFGVKKDAVPGRTNETWVRIDVPGIYYGQCSEICGINHAYMPISVYAVQPEEYTAWLDCVTGDGAESKADFPARACVQSLGFDKYRDRQKAVKSAAVTNSDIPGANE